METETKGKHYFIGSLPGNLQTEILKNEYDSISVRCLIPQGQLRTQPEFC